MSIEKTPDAPLLFQFREPLSSLTVHAAVGKWRKSAIDCRK